MRVAAPFAGTLQQLAVARGGQVAAGAAAVRARARERTRRRVARPSSNCRRRRRGSPICRPASARPKSRPSPSNCARRSRRATWRSPTCVGRSRWPSPDSSAAPRSTMRAPRSSARRRASRSCRRWSRPPSCRGVPTRSAPRRPMPRRRATRSLRPTGSSASAPSPRRSRRQVSDTYFVVGDWVPAGGVVIEPPAAGEREDPVLRSRAADRSDQARAERALRVRWLRRAQAGDDQLHRRSRRVHAAVHLLEGEPLQVRLPRRGASPTRRTPRGSIPASRWTSGCRSKVGESRDAGEATTAPASAPDVVIDVRGLNKHFGDNHVVKDLVAQRARAARSSASWAPTAAARRRRSACSAGCSRRTAARARASATTSCARPRRSSATSAT